MGIPRAFPILARSRRRLPRIGLIHRCNGATVFQKRVDSGGESIHRSWLASESASPANINVESPAITASNPLPRASYLTNQHQNHPTFSNHYSSDCATACISIGAEAWPLCTVTAAFYVTYTLTWSFGYGSIYPNRARSSGAGSVRHYVRAFLFLGLGIFLPQLLRSRSVHT
jgi:hypothetical protein